MYTSTAIIMYKIITLEEGDPHVADMKNCNNNVADMKNCKTVKTVLSQRPLHGFKK